MEIDDFKSFSEYSSELDKVNENLSYEHVTPKNNDGDVEESHDIAKGLVRDIEDALGLKVVQIYGKCDDMIVDLVIDLDNDSEILVKYENKTNQEDPTYITYRYTGQNIEKSSKDLDLDNIDAGEEAYNILKLIRQEMDAMNYFISLPSDLGLDPNTSRKEIDENGNIKIFFKSEEIAEMWIDKLNVQKK